MNERKVTMQNVKAIFLDMDGTILRSNNRASEETAQILNQLREEGYKVFLAVRMKKFTYSFQMIYRLMALFLPMEHSDILENQCCLNMT